MFVQCDQIRHFLKAFGKKLLQKSPKFLVIFRLFLKTSLLSKCCVVATFWASFGKFGLLFIPTSGHTVFTFIITIVFLNGRLLNLSGSSKPFISAYASFKLGSMSECDQVKIQSFTHDKALPPREAISHVIPS